MVSVGNSGSRVNGHFEAHAQLSLTHPSEDSRGTPWNTQDLSSAATDRVCSELGETIGFDSSSPDWFVFEGFLALRKRFRGAIVALSERIMIANLSAAELLLPADRDHLWVQAQAALADGSRRTCGIALTCGLSAIARYRPVVAQDALVGALVQLSVPPRVSPRSLFPDPEVSAWASLTDAERAVAEVVARGLTNREAGRCVYSSPHTVDSHLRQIFRKLGINSRVELARMVGEHHNQIHGTAQGVVMLQPYGPLGNPSARSA
jgi:DNA-binding CsgD family transcriptional regulator